MLTLTDTTVQDLVSGVRAEHDNESVLHALASAAWTYIAEPGDERAGALRQRFGAVDALRIVLNNDTAALEAATPQTSPKAAQDAMNLWQRRAEESQRFARTLRQAVEGGHKLIVPGDALWPAALNDLGASAPAALWVRGNLAALADLGKHSVAIIGARAATHYGETVANTLASEASLHDIFVVTSGAYGIDAAATRAALANGGRAIAVMAGGLDRYYPAGNADLLRQVEERGVVISETPAGTTPTRWRFLQRNRIVAAIASATVIVEAGSRSGSLNAAMHARELGRPLGAVPGPITSAASVGCHRAIREFGAELITTGEEMFGLVKAGDRAEA